MPMSVADFGLSSRNQAWYFQHVLLTQIAIAPIRRNSSQPHARALLEARPVGYQQAAPCEKKPPAS